MNLTKYIPNARDRLTVLSHCISAKHWETSMAQLCFIKLSPYSVCQGKRYWTILALCFPKAKKNHFLNRKKKVLIWKSVQRSATGVSQLSSRCYSTALPQFPNRIVNVRQPAAKPLKSQCHSYELCPINYAEKENKTLYLLCRRFALKESLAAVHHLFAAKAKSTSRYVQKTRLLLYR